MERDKKQHQDPNKSVDSAGIKQKQQTQEMKTGKCI